MREFQFLLHVLYHQDSNNNAGVYAPGSLGGGEAFGVNFGQLVPIKQFNYFYPAIVGIELAFKIGVKVKN